MGDVWMPDRAELQARVLGVGKVAWDKHREKWKRLLRSHPSAEVNVEALEQAVGVAKFLSSMSLRVHSLSFTSQVWHGPKLVWSVRGEVRPAIPRSGVKCPGRASDLDLVGRSFSSSVS